MADWLKRRAHCRRQCSGTGTSASASAKSSRPAWREPAPHHRREVEPVAIFEPMHQRPRNVVEAHGGAGTLVGRRVGDRFHGQDAGTGIVDEGNAEPFAIRPGDEGELRPAGRTEPFALDRLAADRAQPRQGEIERGAQHRAGGFRGALEPRKGSDARPAPPSDCHCRHAIRPYRNCHCRPAGDTALAAVRQ